MKFHNCMICKAEIMIGQGLCCRCKDLGWWMCAECGNIFLEDEDKGTTSERDEYCRCKECHQLHLEKNPDVLEALNAWAGGSIARRVEMRRYGDIHPACVVSLKDNSFMLAGALATGEGETFAAAAKAALADWHEGESK